MALLASTCWMMTPSPIWFSADWAAVVAGMVLVYMLVAEPRPPILRAGVLASLACAAAGIRRPTSNLNWIAAGAILILAWRPADLFGAGFQLSFGVVLAVIYLAPRVRRTLMAVPARWYEIEQLRVVASDETSWERTVRLSRSGALRVLSMVIAAMSVAIAAWLVGAPLVAHHFGRW